MGLITRLDDLISLYPEISVAKPEHNDEVLSFIKNMPMDLKKGGLRFDRDPNFFALAEAQGEESFTFLFRNSDQSLAGIGCISIIPMTIKGRSTYLAYQGDLRLSPLMEKATRIQFAQFHEQITLELKNIKEFKGAETILFCILDNNEAAKRSFASKKKKRPSKLVHRPIHLYDNINVLGAIPGSSTLFKKNQVIRGNEVPDQQIIEFLTTNLTGGEILWTQQEILRRKEKAEFKWSDFYLIVDGEKEILASCLILSDEDYRRAVISKMPLENRVAQIVGPLLGQPAIRTNEPLSIGYLSFLKMKSQDPRQRSQWVSDILFQIFKDFRDVSRDQRYHSITLQEPKTSRAGRHLLKKGFVCANLPSTIYQLIHEDNMKEETLIDSSNFKPDFDLVFH